jgi:WD40 repeat protein
MKRTVAFSPQEEGQDENTTTSDTKNKTAIVASLPVDRSRPINPYSSLTLSPKGHHALVAGKDTIQLVSVGPNGLGLRKTLKIAHHFTAASSSSSPGSNETRNQQQRYGDVRDAFQQQSSAVTAGVTNMNMNQQYGNIIVTKVAWSNDYYCPPRSNHLQQHQHSQRNASAFDDTDMDDSIPTTNTEMKEGGKQRRRRRKQKQRGEKETNADNDYVYVDNNNDDGIESMAEDESLVAAAGSNGVVVVWRAKRLLFSDYGKTNTNTNTKNKSGNRFNIAGVGQGKSSSSSSAAHLAKQQRTQQPEGILSEHTRAVNGLAWHPTRSGLLLTASQDATVKLWERRAVVKHSQSDEQKDRDLQEQQQQQKSWFSMVGGVVGSGSRNSGRGDSAADDDAEEENKYTWRCKATFSLGDAVRDIRWNKLIPDVFGVVTASGNLVVYNMHVSVKALVKIAAHTGDASSLDFHPQRPFIVATGGSADRCVKIWDLESSLDSIVNTNSNRNKYHHYQNNHENANNTWNTTKSNVSNDSASSSESQ